MREFYNKFADLTEEQILKRIEELEKEYQENNDLRFQYSVKTDELSDLLEELKYYYHSNFKSFLNKYVKVEYNDGTVCYMYVDREETHGKRTYSLNVYGPGFYYNDKNNTFMFSNSITFGFEEDHIHVFNSEINEIEIITEEEYENALEDFINNKLVDKLKSSKVQVDYKRKRRY